MTFKSRIYRSATVAACWLASSAAFGGTDWPFAGKDLNNSRYQDNEEKISVNSVAGLKLKWVATTAGDVTANPAVEGNYLYFPDSAGFLYKLNKKTGAVVWKKPVSDYTGIAGDFARATPAISGNALILGNQSGKFLQAFGQPAPQPARVFAVDKNTGAALWATEVDSTVMSFVTHSAIVAKGVALVGVASNEELVAGFVPKSFWQWNFRGSVVALDVNTGAIKWKTYTVPQGYYGGAVWGSTGAVDLDSNTAYMATGNNYWVPEAVQNCINAGGSPSACMSADNHFDSIIALDLTTGAIKWAARGLPYDAWNVGCGLNVPGLVIPPNDNCPNPKGPDWDFSQGPMLFSGSGNDSDDDNDRDKVRGKGSKGGQLVGAGQKSGKFWAFNAKTGSLAWVTQVAPGGLTGGLQWGSATDDKRIYVAVANSGLTGGGVTPEVWHLKDGTSTTAGGWAALNPKSGAVIWETKDPMGSRAEAAVSVANNVVFGCNLEPGVGRMYALNAKTGAPLWSYAGAGACNAGPSIVDGMVFWGSGTFGFAPGPRLIYAFGL